MDNKEKVIIKTLRTSIITLSIISIFNFIGIANTSYSLFNKTVNSKNNIKLKTSTMQYNFDYTGGEQTFTVPLSGTYKLETWGAQGGYYGTTTAINYGGYSVGNIKINKNQIIYINSGGMGQSGYDAVTGYNKEVKGGYNGGGSGYTWIDVKTTGGGGGATHIATKSGILSTLENSRDSILIVSGGGGGQGGDYSDNTYYQEGFAGAGGGYIGNNSKKNNNYIGTGEVYSQVYTNTSGNQTLPGTMSSFCSTSRISASFGVGESAAQTYAGNLGNSSGGGSGYYGGGAGCGYGGFGAGGSGYVGNTSLTDKHMACYNCETSNEVSTKTISVTCASETPTSDCAKIGNGYARITYIGN